MGAGFASKYDLKQNRTIDMLNLKKILRLGGSKQSASLAPLILSDSLCNSLLVLSQIFGQTWHQLVVGELVRARQIPNPPSGAMLAGIINKLLEEASIPRPGLSSRFVVSGTQIVYRSADRRYVVLIVQGEGDAVRVMWQVSVRQAGTSYISYVVQGKSWTPVEWEVAEPCMENLELLAKVGGEVLGFLGEYKLLPEGSPFQKAMEQQIENSSAMRQTAQAEA